MNALRTIRSASWAFSLLYVVSGGVFSPTRRRCVRPVLCRGRTRKKGKVVEPASAEPVTSLSRFFCRCGKLRCCCVSLRKNSFQEEDGCPFLRLCFLWEGAALHISFSGARGYDFCRICFEARCSASAEEVSMLLHLSAGKDATDKKKAARAAFLLQGNAF